MLSNSRPGITFWPHERWLGLASASRNEIPCRVVGLGMNEVELKEPPKLNVYMIQNPNRTPTR